MHEIVAAFSLAMTDLSYSLSLSQLSVILISCSLRFVR